MHRYYFIIQNDIKMLQYKHLSLHFFFVFFSCLLLLLLLFMPYIFIIPHKNPFILFIYKYILFHSILDEELLMNEWIMRDEHRDERYIRWCDYVMYTIPMLSEWILLEFAFRVWAVFWEMGWWFGNGRVSKYVHAESLEILKETSLEDLKEFKVQARFLDSSPASRLLISH